MELKNVCKIIGILFLILGILGSFVIAAKYGGTTTYYSGLTRIEGGRNWVFTIVLFLIGAASSITTATIFLALSQLLEYVEYIYNRTLPSDTASIEEDTLRHGGWKCPKCGRVNNSYTGTCSCGESKPQ